MFGVIGKLAICFPFFVSRHPTHSFFHIPFAPSSECQVPNCCSFQLWIFWIWRTRTAQRPQPNRTRGKTEGTRVRARMLQNDNRQPTTTPTTSHQIEMSTSFYRGAIWSYSSTMFEQRMNKRTKNEMFSMHSIFRQKLYKRANFTQFTFIVRTVLYERCFSYVFLFHLFMFVFVL